MTTTIKTYYLILRNDGRYLGASTWTFDIQRALHFDSKEAAEQKAKGYQNVIVIPSP